jgi:hypothetical protein
VIGIETKWAATDASAAHIRRRIIDTVERLDPYLDQLDALLVVVGTHDEAGVELAQAHLTSAIGAHTPTRVIGWLPDDDSTRLKNALRQLAT